MIPKTRRCDRRTAYSSPPFEYPDDGEQRGFVIRPFKNSELTKHCLDHCGVSDTLSPCGGIALQTSSSGEVPIVCYHDSSAGQTPTGQNLVSGTAGYRAC